MSKIEVNNVYLDYTDNDENTYSALEGVSFHVEEGEFVSIIGSSGCGKSTILGLLSGIRPYKSGTVLIDGSPVTGPGKNRSIVFQHYSLFAWMTSKQNVCFGLKQAFGDKSDKEIAEIAEHYLEIVGLKEFQDKYPFQLSGGMQQRVAIARTLSMKTDIIFMDEPFGAIDAKNRMALQDLLLELLENEKEKKTIVFVTHDMDEAILLSDRTLFMRTKRIERDIDIGIPRPRVREKLFRGDRYAEIRREIMELFYENVMENSVAGEVYL